jgi:glycosyltransferase involved in cell wall biosynthesis
LYDFTDRVSAPDLYLPQKPTVPRIVFTVTNDLSYDQRMHRIAGTLAGVGYKVLLVGRERMHSIPLAEKNFRQKRLTCWSDRGFLFYAEYNLRLFFFLLLTRADILCAIDLDTILPVYFSSVLKNQKRVYDAHELFTEQIEIVRRPGIHRFWLALERFALPRFPTGYTVNEWLRGEFNRRYGVNYSVIKNLPVKTLLQYERKPADEKYFFYQGAVNEGRCFETLIPAMQQVSVRLLICGSGNFMEQAKALVAKYGLEQKVIFIGTMEPLALQSFTQKAYAGINLFESSGMNQYHSLSNRFFDYIMAGIPQLCVNYPEYAFFMAQHRIGLMIDDISVATIANALNSLLSDETQYGQMREACIKARENWNWEKEAQTLIDIYNKL